MLLTPGACLGNYEIVEPLGAGGMGEVYRAEDTRLCREVALKVLPEAFACDADRLSRFEREARTVAGLNHPNIVVLHRAVVPKRTHVAVSLDLDLQPLRLDEVRWLQAVHGEMPGRRPAAAPHPLAARDSSRLRA